MSSWSFASAKGEAEEYRIPKQSGRRTGAMAEMADALGEYHRNDEVWKIRGGEQKKARYMVEESE